jgi:hypothetical protein
MDEGRGCGLGIFFREKVSPVSLKKQIVQYKVQACKRKFKFRQEATALKFKRWTKHPLNILKDHKTNRGVLRQPSLLHVWNLNRRGVLLLCMVVGHCRRSHSAGTLPTQAPSVVSPSPPVK